MNNYNSVKIGELYNKYLSKGYEIHNTPTGHELIYPKNLKVCSIGNEFKKIKCLSRHKTSKSLVKIEFKKAEPLIVTTDHVCMAYNDDRILENIASKDLRIGMMVKHHDKVLDVETIDTISNIHDLGPTEDYVYDLEVEDESHVFYANDTLIHNSFFMNLEAVTKDFIKKYGWDDNMNNWTDEQKLKMFAHMEDFTDNWLVPHVQELITREFHTSNAKVMKYGLEYMTSGGIFEQKKKYIVHQIVVEGPKVVDKFKYTGIELKRGTIPPEVKKFMKDIYFTAVLDKNFNGEVMRKKIDDVYQEILKMDANALGTWVGYGTERQMEGFLVAEKGSTGVSKSCGYYNQIIKKLHLEKKYPLINVKDKVQCIYLKPTNIYGIDQIAFPPRQWPKEFDDIFEIDYSRMIEKLTISPLKSFMAAMRITGLQKYDPSIVANLEYNVDDI